MGLEAATYIDTLVTTNPVGASDPKSQGDDHIRMIKSVLKATFPALTGPMTLTQAQINALNTKAGVEAVINAGPGGISPIINVPAVGADWNTTTAAGWFVDQRAAGSANAPEAGSAWMGLNIWAEDANNLVQIAIPDVLNAAQAKGLYMRARSAGTWGAWRHIIYESDINTLITNINAAALTFSNKSLVDASTLFIDDADNTKKMRFELSGITTGQTRILTVPNFNATLASLAGTETLQNKTLDHPLGINTPVDQAPVASTIAASSNFSGAAAAVQTPNPATGSAAFLSFLRQGAYGANIGLDTDNEWKVGGWSMGAVARKILHEGLSAATFLGNYTFAGTVNFGNIQENGFDLPITRGWESAQQAFGAGTRLILPHGLGIQPKLYAAFLVCVGAEGGYAVGQEVALNPGFGTTDVASGRGLSMIPDATNLDVKFGSDTPPIRIIDRNGNVLTLNSGNWRAVFRAWA